VANFIRYRPKSAVRDVGKALGFSSSALERLAKNLGAWWEDPEVNLDKNLSEELRDSPLDDGSDSSAGGTADRRALLKILCREIQDFPRHLSIHPGGFILGSRPIAHLVPVENAAMSGRTVIQWDKYDVEAMNLFKIDLLGLGALTHLDYTMRLLGEHTGVEISLADISRNGDDPEVFEALCRGDSVGVFQVESRAQMAMLPRLKPRRFYDLVIEISIVRPGPISGGMVHPYLRRRNGEEEVTYPHPTLEPVLKKTLGVPLFQEQVMKLAVAAADYTPGEADQLRRDMGAWKSSSRLALHREKLISGMLGKGITPEFAESVYRQIQGFGEYGFPESHAASFALIAYATAWFKVKYPAFFTCGLLNAWPMGFYSPATVVDDALRHGIPILPVDIRRSVWDCLPERSGADDAWGVRMGLRYVKGLSRDAGSVIEKLRNEMIGSVDEFALRSGIGVKMMKALTLSGAFDGLSGNRRTQLWQSLIPRSSREEEGPGEERYWGYSEDDPMSFEPLNRIETVEWDYSGSMHSTRGHPVEALREELRKQGIPDSSEVRELADGRTSLYAGLVICRQRPGTANGVLFITLEDEFGFVNLVVWQKVYEEFRELILTRSLLGVKGKIQSKDGIVHLIVSECFDPPGVPGWSGIVSRDFR
jgi:error-prone DNA polymerase